VVLSLNPRDNRDCPSASVLRALASPIRLRILEVATSDPGQRFSASKIRDALALDFEVLKLKEVNYHLRRLEDAGLLPRPIARG
jgi:DNA-binding transcriptional ArsR family regulator